MTQCPYFSQGLSLCVAQQETTVSLEIAFKLVCSVCIFRLVRVATFVTFTGKKSSVTGLVLIYLSILYFSRKRLDMSKTSYLLISPEPGQGR